MGKPENVIERLMQKVWTFERGGGGGARKKKLEKDKEGGGLLFL